MDPILEEAMASLDTFYGKERASKKLSNGTIIWPPPEQPIDSWSNPESLELANIKRVKAWTEILDKSLSKTDSSSKKMRSASKKQSRRTLAWRSFKQVSVAGIDAALDRRAPLLRRLLWTCVLVVCMTLMFAQCLNRVMRYLDEPVNVNVRVTHNETLEYPSITLCNKNTFNRSAALELLIKYKILPPEAPVEDVNISKLIGVDGMTPSILWTKLAHKLDVFITECWFGRGVTCDLQGTWSLVHTVMGPCHTYRLSDTHVKFVGSFNNMYMKLWDSTPPVKDERGFRILMHDEKEMPILTSRTHAMSAELGWSREIKMELRKFEQLSTAKTPCNNKASYSLAQCYMDCFQAVIKENNINCRMPYMVDDYSRNLSECSTPNEYQEAVTAIHDLLIVGGWSTSSCNCPQQCKQTAFQLYPENIVFKPDHVKLRIFYEDLIYEQITEDMAYNMVALLCDIGGTLGLLMGASVLTMCELLEVLWSRFLLTCCRRNPKKKKKKVSVSVVSDFESKF